MAFELNTGLPLAFQAQPVANPLQMAMAAQQFQAQRENMLGLREQRAAIADERRARTEAARLDAERSEALRGLKEWTPETVFPILGPDAGAKALKAINDLHMGEFDNEEKVRKSFATRVEGIAALPESMRPEAWSLAVQDYGKRGVMDPAKVGEYSPEKLAQFQRELMSPEQRANADKPDLRNVGNALVSVGKDGKATPIYTAPDKETAPGVGTLGDFMDSYAQSVGLKSGKQLNPRQKLQAKSQFEAAGRAPTNDNEPLVAIMGPDGQSVLVPRSQAVGKRPASNKEQGRPVTSGDANKIADIDTSLKDLSVLRGAVKDPGTLTRIQSAMPTWVSEITGGWSDDAKQQNAVIARVRQVIGKALEGGVLRKEDEEKYKNILPVIGDPKAVALSKIEGLEAALTQRRSTQLDSLADAGYDTSKFAARAPKAPAAPAAPPAGNGMVAMVAPDGRQLMVPADKVREMEGHGARKVGG